MTPRLPLRRVHRWDHEHERNLAASEFADGNARTERDCVLCGIVKVTVHAPNGFAWREWKHPKSDIYFQADHTPPCNALIDTPQGEKR